jgi:hypothetical protein
LERPYRILLFDEIEKAYPKVLGTGIVWSKLEKVMV